MASPAAASSRGSNAAAAAAAVYLLCGTIVLLASPADAASCADPCYTSDSRNQGIIAYLLNLEYLLAESYSCWTTGAGIPAGYRGSGPASIGCTKMAFGDPLIAALAAEFAKDNLAHVENWRTQLGAAANPIPLLNVGNTANPTDAVTSFIHSALTASGYTITTSSTTPPPVLGSMCTQECTAYCKTSPMLLRQGAPASTPDQIFLLSAYIYEDVVNTAYMGDVSLIADSFTGLGIEAAASYHAGSVRQQLIQQAFAPVDSFGGLPVHNVTDAISVYRAMLSERYVPGNIDETDDQNILLADDVTPDLVPSNGYTYDRIPSQTTAIFCGSTTATQGLFFPKGFTSAITSAPVLPGNYPAGVGVITTKDTFTYILNLEYLENLINEIRGDEYDHVAFFQSEVGGLGGPVPAKPAINLTAFADVANAAFNKVLDPPFDPFKDDLSMLIATYIFEDVGVSAYLSAVATIMDRSYLRPGGGIAAVESYHAGAVRTLLLQNASTIVQPFGVSVASICEAISNIRAELSHASDDNGILTTAGTPSILYAPSTGIVYPRTAAEVIQVTTMGSPTGVGGFFPTGFHGVVNGTSASLGSATNLPS